MKNSFKMNFPPFVVFLLILCTLISMGGVFFNIYEIVNYSALNDYKLISYIVLTVLSVALFVLCFSLLFFAKYKVKDEKLKIYFGIIVFSVKLKDVVSVTFFKKTQQTALILSNSTYSFIMIKKEFLDDFVKSIRFANNTIFYQEEEFINKTK